MSNYYIEAIMHVNGNLCKVHTPPVENLLNLLQDCIGFK